MKNCQNQRNSWKNTFLGQTRRNLSPQQSNKLKNLRKSQKSQKSQKISNNLKNLKKSQNLRKSQKISKISKISENLKNLRKSQKISKNFGIFWDVSAGSGWAGLAWGQYNNSLKWHTTIQNDKQHFKMTSNTSKWQATLQNDKQHFKMTSNTSKWQATLQNGFVSGNDLFNNKKLVICFGNKLISVLSTH